MDPGPGSLELWRPSRSVPSISMYYSPSICPSTLSIFCFCPYLFFKNSSTNLGHCMPPVLRPCVPFSVCNDPDFSSNKVNTYVESESPLPPPHPLKLILHWLELAYILLSSTFKTFLSVTFLLKHGESPLLSSAITSPWTWIAMCIPWCVGSVPFLLLAVVRQWAAAVSYATGPAVCISILKRQGSRSRENHPGRAHQ